MRAAELGGRRVREHVGDVADTGGVGDHRPVEKAGAVAVRRIDEEVAEMRIAVHERARAFAVERHHAGGPGLVQLGELHEAGRQAVGEVVDCHAHHARATVAAAGGARRDPREITSHTEPRRLPVARGGGGRAARRCRRCGPRCRRRRASGSGTRWSRGLRGASRNGRRRRCRRPRSRRTRRGIRTGSSVERSRYNRASTTPIPCRLTNLRCAASNGASLANTVGGTLRWPVSASRACPVVPEWRSRTVTVSTSVSSASESHAGCELVYLEWKRDRHDREGTVRTS